ncbi:MAG: glycosyltransferase family 39 protein [Pyrinomonadaceae bacterium]
MQKPQAISNHVIFGLIVLHLLIVLPLAYFLNIWADEASTLYTTQHGFWPAFQNAAADEKQAPLYFWIMSLWRYINGSIFFARLFSIICIVAAIKVFADLATRLFKPRAALLATAFFAFHPYLFWASLEIRVYSLVILLSLILIRLFFDAFIEESEPNARKNSRILFTVVAVIAVYTNYYLGFVLIGLFAALLVSGKWREARIYLGLMLLVAAAFSPLLLIKFESQLAANTSGFNEEQSIFKGVRNLWRHFLTFILPTELLPNEQFSIVGMVRLWIIRIALVVVGLFVVVRRKSISSSTLLLGAVTATTFGGLFFAYFVVGSNYIQIRHASVLFVPLVLFAAALLSDIFVTDGKQMRAVNKTLAIAASLIVLASFSYSIVALYPNMAKRGDWARVGAFIQQNEWPGQPIMVFPTYEALALPYHYHGVNRISPDEEYFKHEEQAAFGTQYSLTKEIDFFISNIPPDADWVWLAVSERCLITEACRPLENYVQANYTIEKEQEFYLEKLFLLRKKAQ